MDHPEKTICERCGKVDYIHSENNGQKGCAKCLHPQAVYLPSRNSAPFPEERYFLVSGIDKTEGSLIVAGWVSELRSREGYALLRELDPNATHLRSCTPNEFIRETNPDEIRHLPDMEDWEVNYPFSEEETK